MQRLFAKLRFEVKISFREPRNNTFFIILTRVNGAPRAMWWPRRVQVTHPFNVKRHTDTHYKQTLLCVPRQSQKCYEPRQSRDEHNVIVQEVIETRFPENSRITWSDGLPAYDSTTLRYVARRVHKRFITILSLHAPGFALKMCADKCTTIIRCTFWWLTCSSLNSENDGNEYVFRSVGTRPRPCACEEWCAGVSWEWRDREELGEMWGGRLPSIFQHCVPSRDISGTDWVMNQEEDYLKSADLKWSLST